MINELIEDAFANFTVGGMSIPVAFLQYTGKSNSYVTYMQTDVDQVLSSDDDIENYIDFYDFDIYTKGDNYFAIIEAVKLKLKANGFSWQPSRDSGDLFESDTGFYHKTLCFAIERSN